MAEENLRLEQTGAAAGRTLAGSEEAVPVERETARLTLRGQDIDAPSLRLGRPECVAEIILDIPAFQAELPRQR